MEIAAKVETIIHKIKFFLKQRNGIILVVDQVMRVCGSLRVSGWAVSKKGEKGIESIEIYLNDTFLGNATYGDPRADVKNLYSFIPHSGQSGFHFHKDVSNVTASEANAQKIIIKAIGFDGRSHNVQKILKNHYDKWITAHEPGYRELERQRQIIFPYEPRINLITSIHTNTPQQFSVEMIKSVLSQTYPNWDLCIACSVKKSHLKRILEAYTQQDSRIHVKILPENTGIVETLNEALNLAIGDFVGLLHHGDTLAPFALFEVAKSINDTPDVEYMYSDEDRLSEDGNLRHTPYLKPDWSPDMLRSTNYPANFSVFKKQFIRQIGGFREGFEGSLDYDVILRATEQATQIVHIPKVLYHRWASSDSPVEDRASKGYTDDSAKRALEEHLKRMGLRGNVGATEEPGYYKVTYILQETPKVSIIIPNRDHADELERCINSIITKTSYRKFEIIIVENGSCENETFVLYEKFKKINNIQIIEWEHHFNYSAVNNFAEGYAQGGVLLFLNNDIEVINFDWLERMLDHAVRKDVGAVGTKLYYPDHTIQHAGLVIGICGIVGHCHKFFPGESSGYMRRLKTIQNFSAVTAACLMLRKEIFKEVGGFDDRFSLNFNDVDLCLKVRERGYVIVWTPYAELYHLESKTRAYDDNLRPTFRQEKRFFQQKWKKRLEKSDPYYNPNLTLEREDFSIMP